MQIEDYLIDEQRKNYKCFDELKRLLKENKDFRQKVINGYANGKIVGFNEEIWNKINKQNIRRINNFEDVFIEGANIGYCTVASKQLSYSFDNVYICGGELPILKGTKNCKEGEHTWIETDNQIIDTTLMLIIAKDYSKEIGYKEENKYNPNIDPIYLVAKEITRDSSLRKR